MINDITADVNYGGLHSNCSYLLRKQRSRGFDTSSQEKTACGNHEILTISLTEQSSHVKDFFSKRTFNLFRKTEHFVGDYFVTDVNPAGKLEYSEYIKIHLREQQTAELLQTQVP